MICPVCQTVNPEAAKFCFNCGHKFESQKDESESAIPEARLRRMMPAELLNKMESARAHGAMEGERRVVTILFCDVAGSTETASTMDPEDWGEIMNGAFERMIGPVYRYEGSVVSLLGDGLLAFFGAPISHEDDPQRGVLAGLEIMAGIHQYAQEVERDWGCDFDARIGINTGLVVVGAMGSDLRMEYSALGDAVNVAARMEQSARPGTVQITEDTHKQVVSQFEFEDLGGIEVKGKSEPVPSFSVMGLKTEPGRVRGIEGLNSPLVGRDAEIHSLRGSMIKLRQGQGQIVSIVGEAGLGKSRLIADLRLAPTPVIGSKARLLWLEGYSLSYETTSPYAPFIHLLKACFGLHSVEDDADRLAFIHGQIAEVVGDKAETITPLLATLLDIELSGESLERVRYLKPPQLRAGIFEALYTYFECLALSQPLVLVLDDLHWIDATSLDLLLSLLPLTAQVPLAILALFRPHEGDFWRFHEAASASWSENYTMVQLSPLADDDAQQLVANLLDMDDFSPKLRSLILSKAEGNPFFVEEVIRSLLDSGAVIQKNGQWQATDFMDALSVPDSLAAVINSRLDRLDEHVKQVAQIAAVIGREFNETILSEVYDYERPLDPMLADLQRRELILAVPNQPQATYMFKHVLTQETAYNSLLYRRRRQLHVRVALSLVKHAPDQVREIARHHLEAGQVHSALPFLLDAGDRAIHTFAKQEAIADYGKALEILESVDDVALAQRAYEGLGKSYMLSYDYSKAVETFEAMLDFAEKRGVSTMQVSAHNKLAEPLGIGFARFDEALEHLEKAENLATASDNLSGLAEGQMLLCGFNLAQANFEGAVHSLSNAAEIGTQIDADEPRLFGLSHIASTLVLMMRFDEAWDYAHDALQLAIESGYRNYQAEVLCYPQTLYHLVQSNWQAARDAAEEGLEIAAAIGDHSSSSFGAYWLGYIELRQGRYEAALIAFARTLKSSEIANNPWFKSMALCATGSTLTAISPTFASKAFEYHRRAQAIIEGSGGLSGSAYSWQDLGAYYFANGELEEATKYFDMGLTQPSQAMYLAKPLLLADRARVAMARSNWDAAGDALKQAQTYSDDNKLSYAQPIISFTTGKLAEAEGDATRALDYFLQAEAAAQNMEMLPLIRDAAVAAARLLEEDARRSEAATMRETALLVEKAMVDLFEDTTLRQAFLERTQT